MPSEAANFNQQLKMLDSKYHGPHAQAPSAISVKPPKAQAGAVTRPPKFDDSKSLVSKVSSRAGSSKPKGGTSNILSREEEARLAKEKKERLDSIKRQYSQVSAKNARARSQGRKSSPTGGTTRCTRDEDINIEEFMKDDLRQINREEDRV